MKEYGRENLRPTYWRPRSKREENKKSFKIFFEINASIHLMRISVEWKWKACWSLNFTFLSHRDIAWLVIAGTLKTYSPRLRSKEPVTWSWKPIRGFTGKYRFRFRICTPNSRCTLKKRVKTKSGNKGCKVEARLRLWAPPTHIVFYTFYTSFILLYPAVIIFVSCRNWWASILKTSELFCLV